MYELTYIIIVLYNLELDDEVMARLFNIKNIKYIVVDNSDQITGNADKLNRLSYVHYISNDKNLGIATALNIGCQYALEQGCKWVITMDQDSKITDEILDKLFDFAITTPNLNAAVISPRHVMKNNNKINIPDEDAQYSDGLYAMSSGNLLNLEVWNKLGRFMDELFIDMVDVEYYCRVISSGYKVITLNKVPMEHSLGNFETRKFCGRSLKILNHNYVRKYYQVRNGMYVYFKYRKLTPQVTIVLHFVISLFIKLPFEKNDKLRKLRYMLIGACDYFRNKLGPL